MSKAPNPWSKFFWSDWESDQGLRLCSLAAQGLWMRLLCICARHEPKGYLCINNYPLENRDIARLAGVTESEVETLMSDLDRNGVFNRDRKGRIYSRRMIRDEKRSKIGKKNKERGLLQATENKGKNSLPSRGASREPPSPEARGQKPDSSIERDKSLSRDFAEIDEAVGLFNRAADDLGLPKVQKLTKRRRQLLAARLKDSGGLDGWQHAMDKVRGSPFLRGETGRNGWKADFDFLITESKFTKLMEGAYDRFESNQQQFAAQSSRDQSGFDSFLEAAQKSGSCHDT